MRSLSSVFLLLAGLFAGSSVQAQGVIYRCPGNNFTNAITPKEAETRGCKVVEGGNLTIVESVKPSGGGAKPSGGTGGTPSSSAPAAPRPADSKVDASAQRARDSDARRILEAELRKEEELLAALQKEYNNGEPERRGDERNYQKYQERVADLKASISRKESDISSIKRELGKLPAP